MVAPVRYSFTREGKTETLDRDVDVTISPREKGFIISNWGRDSACRETKRGKVKDLVLPGLTIKNKDIRKWVLRKLPQKIYLAYTPSTIAIPEQTVEALSSSSTGRFVETLYLAASDAGYAWNRKAEARLELSDDPHFSTSCVSGGGGQITLAWEIEWPAVFAFDLGGKRVKIDKNYWVTVKLKGQKGKRPDMWISHLGESAEGACKIPDDLFNELSNRHRK
jgi:hypothetical protein